MLDINVIGQQLPRSEYWFVPDLLLICALAIGLVGGRSLLMTQLRAQVEQVEAQTAKLNEAIAQTETEIAGAEQAAEKLKDLESRHQVLMGLKDQQVVRFKPIIVMELLQKAKPAGLWFEAIELVRTPSSDQTGDKPSSELAAYPHKIRITGRATSQKLVGNYASALAATSQASANNRDPRTQIYFDRINLVSLERRQAPLQVDEVDESNSEVIAPFYQFVLDLSFLERTAQNDF
jgi:Tfp pilus assembly protein PilN